MPTLSTFVKHLSKLAAKGIALDEADGSTFTVKSGDLIDRRTLTACLNATFADLNISCQNTSLMHTTIANFIKYLTDHKTSIPAYTPLNSDFFTHTINEIFGHPPPGKSNSSSEFVALKMETQRLRDVQLEIVRARHAEQVKVRKLEALLAEAERAKQHLETKLSRLEQEITYLTTKMTKASFNLYKATNCHVAAGDDSGSDEEKIPTSLMTLAATTMRSGAGGGMRRSRSSSNGLNVLVIGDTNGAASASTTADNGMRFLGRRRSSGSTSSSTSVSPTSRTRTARKPAAGGGAGRGAGADKPTRAARSTSAARGTTDARKVLVSPLLNALKEQPQRTYSVRHVTGRGTTKGQRASSRGGSDTAEPSR